MKVYVDFTKDQLSKIDTAYKNKSEVSLFLSKDQFLQDGNFPINLSSVQLDRIKKGEKITLSKTSVQELGNKIKTFLKKHSGGFLPLLAAAIPYIAGAAGTAGGIAGIVSAVNSKKHQNKMEQETKRHNKALEDIVQKKNGDGLYVKKNLKKF